MEVQELKASHLPARIKDCLPFPVRLPWPSRSGLGMGLCRGCRMLAGDHPAGLCNRFHH